MILPDTHKAAYAAFLDIALSEGVPKRKAQAFALRCTDQLFQLVPVPGFNKSRRKNIVELDLNKGKVIIHILGDRHSSSLYSKAQEVLESRVENPDRWTLIRHSSDRMAGHVSYIYRRTSQVRKEAAASTNQTKQAARDTRNAQSVEESWANLTLVQQQELLRKLTNTKRSK